MKVMDPVHIRRDFPVFRHHPGLVYLDSTASSLKPQVVIDAERAYYETSGVNVHRGVYALSQQATDAYEAVREQVRGFINAASTSEIVFVRGATEAINLVASTYGQRLRKGDVILLSEMEHHANIVPWQALQQWIGVELRWIPVTADGDLDLTNIDELLHGVKLVAVTQMSNVLGVVNNVKRLTQAAHAAGAAILIDAAQSVPHLPVDVRDIDCDFLVFSGHKMLAPSGVGVLYGKRALLEEMPPYQRGGDMIREVTKEGASWNDLPWKFEAGTPNIGGVIGLGAAINYLSTIGMSNIWAHDQSITRYALDKLKQLSGITVLGATAQSPRGAIFAIDIPNVHPHDIGSIMDERQICVRAGHHCAQPLHARFNLAGTTRASGYLYTTEQDIDALIDGIRAVQSAFA